MEFLIHWVGWIIIFHAADYNRFKNGDSIKPFSKDHWYQIVLILIAAILLKVEY
jgi:hypothetical protein